MIVWCSNNETLLAPEAVAMYCAGESFAWVEFPRTFKVCGHDETYIAEQDHEGHWSIRTL